MGMREQYTRSRTVFETRKSLARSPREKGREHEQRHRKKGLDNVNVSFRFPAAEIAAPWSECEKGDQQAIFIEGLKRARN
jgi:hypothetical protein